MRFHLLLNKKNFQSIFITKASAKQVFYTLSGRILPLIRKKLGCINKKVRK